MRVIERDASDEEAEFKIRLWDYMKVESSKAEVSQSFSRLMTSINIPDF